MKTPRSAAFAVSLLISFTAQAKSGGSGGREPRFMADAGIYAGTGTMASSSNSIASRAMNSGAIMAEIGMRFGFVVPFARVDYGIAGQSQDPSGFNNQNMSGTGYISSAGVRFDIKRASLSFAVEFGGSFKLDKKTTGDLESTYSSPSGMLVEAAYRFDSRRRVFLLYQQTAYVKSTLGSSDTDISNNKLTHMNYGAGFAYAIF